MIPLPTLLLVYQKHFTDPLEPLYFLVFPMANQEVSLDGASSVEPHLALQSATFVSCVDYSTLKRYLHARFSTSSGSK